MKPLYLALVAVLLIIAGSAVLYSGFNGSETTHKEPYLDSPLFAPEGQGEVGPTKAVVTPNPDTMQKDELSQKYMGEDKLFIPTLGVYANINTADGNGRLSRNTMNLPKAHEVTRWVDGATVTDKNGSILLAGHVRYNREHGALYDLEKAPLGSVAFVSDDEGNSQKFQLESLEPYRSSELPTTLWDTTGEKKLVVVTCGGDVRRTSRGWVFEDSVVTTWKPVAPVMHEPQI